MSRAAAFTVEASLLTFSLGIWAVVPATLIAEIALFARVVNRNSYAAKPDLALFIFKRISKLPDFLKLARQPIGRCNRISVMPCQGASSKPLIEVGLGHEERGGLCPHRNYWRPASRPTHVARRNRPALPPFR